MKKLFNTKTVLAAVAACITLISTGCSVDVDLTPEEKDQVNDIIGQITEIAKDSDIKVNVNDSVDAANRDQKEIKSENDHEESETENVQKETETEIAASEDDNSASQDDEEYRNILLSYFKENCDTFNTAFNLKSGGATIQRSSDEIVWYDTETNEIYWCGDGDMEGEVVDYSAHIKYTDENNYHDTSNVARKLDDPRFSNLDEYNVYLRTIFTEGYLENESCGRGRFVEYNGKTYIADRMAGMLFDKWYADQAEVTEFEKDRSFTVLVPGMIYESAPDETLYGTFNFVNTDNGWRIDSIGYNNLTNTRF